MGAATNCLVAMALTRTVGVDSVRPTGDAGLALQPAAWLLLLAVLQISAVVPIPTSPGRIGLFHYLCVVTLAIFGTEKSVAMSYGLVLHIVTYLPMVVGGPVGLWSEMRPGSGALSRARAFAAGDRSS
jgi:hypothetical protein